MVWRFFALLSVITIALSSPTRLTQDKSGDDSDGDSPKIAAIPAPQARDDQCIDSDLYFSQPRRPGISRFSDDCQEALNGLKHEKDINSRTNTNGQTSSQPYTFYSDWESRPPWHYPPVRLPIPFTHGRCAFVVVGMAQLAAYKIDDDDDDDSSLGKYQSWDVSDMAEIYGLAHNLQINCASKGLAGYSLFDNDKALVLFMWQAGSPMDRSWKKILKKSYPKDHETID